MILFYPHIKDYGAFCLEFGGGTKLPILWKLYLIINESTIYYFVERYDKETIKNQGMRDIKDFDEEEIFFFNWE